MHVEAEEAMVTGIDFISQRAARGPELKFDSVMHHINEGTLKASFHELGRNRALGVDGISWQEYGKNLDANIKGLLGRMKRMGYRPQAVRRVYIPKGRNAKRPLGLPTIEDKMVQKAMVKVMEAIYEQDFHECSYGFRPKRSCHQALKTVSKLINDRPVNHVIEADVKGFFDNVPHEKLMGLVMKRITDKTFLRYIVRFLKSGYMEKGVLIETKKGTPQGGNISPMLANIFLHYVLDEWFTKEVKPYLKGQSYLIRYCDDFVILAQNKVEAQGILDKLRERFKQYGMELNQEKTRVVSFGSWERENAKKQQRGPNTFNFLGFTHYCSRTRGGKFKVGRKTNTERFSRMCREIGAWLKLIRNMAKLKELWKMLQVKLRGHYEYYGVSENWRGIAMFYRAVLRLVYKWINRRSQRRSFNWEQFTEYLKLYPLPKPRIVHSFYD